MRMVPAVLIVEPDAAYGAWLAGALTGTGERAIRTAGPDEAMAALATEGAEVLGALVGPSLDDGDALDLAVRLQAAAPDVATVLVRHRDSGELLRAALRAGVRDVVTAPRDGETVRDALAGALEVARALRGRLAGPPPTPAGERRAPGRVVTVFGAKGGCGKTFLATNLAVALAGGGAEVALVDLDLAFGDVAVMLRLVPGHTVHDAAAASLDAITLKSLLTRHRAGVWVLAAPPEPTAAEAVGAAAVGSILRLLREAFDHVVVDTPATLGDQVLAALDESDQIAVLASLDVPSVKNTKLALQTMELLGYPRSRLRLVVNRADAHVGLRLAEVERLLGTRVDATVPSSRSVPLSVNRGSPILVDEPRGPVAQAVRRLAVELAGTRPSRAGRSRRSLLARS
jgi:pilus assembly protein CpaE